MGGADKGISVEEAERFRRALEEAGAEHELVVYPGAPHSFFDRSQEEHRDASADAWARTLGFIADHAGLHQPTDA
ncbi:MAG TPA: dienelactone hydrolase family protein [Gaiella sp.]|jgi:carboxymethylenebutenolidase|nr:dienelactone hydrolase family protein [Gaiella sp.]